MASPILKNTLEVDLKNKNNKTKQKYRKISKTRWCKGPPVLSLDFSRNTSSYRDKSTSEGCAQLHNVLGSSKESKGLLQLQSLRSLQREMVFLVTNTTFRTWCFSENNKEGCSHTHTHTHNYFSALNYSLTGVQPNTNEMYAYLWFYWLGDRATFSGCLYLPAQNHPAFVSIQTNPFLQALDGTKY